MAFPKVESDEVLPSARSLGTCFGFEVRSALNFHYLRSGRGDPIHVSAPSSPPAEAGELVQTWPGSAEVPIETRLYSHNGLFHLKIGESTWFHIDVEQRRVVVPDDGDTVKREERLWGIPAILCFLARGDLQLHSAAVEVNGGAVVIAAPQIHGKTTFAAMCHNAGFRVLSEDATCIRDLTSPHVIPGPAVLRLRRATAERIEITGAREVAERDHKAHFAIDPERRGDCNPVPLRAILLLRESEAGFRLERPRPVDTVRDLWPLSVNLPTQADRARCFSAVTDLTRAVPIWNFYRPFRLEELPAAVNFVADNV
jgi:hypothetical protein